MRANDPDLDYSLAHVIPFPQDPRAKPKTHFNTFNFLNYNNKVKFEHQTQFRSHLR